MSAPLRMGIVGFGKIAREQHAPAIARTVGLQLCAVASLAGAAEEVPTYGSLAEMLAAHPDIDAVALCQPPAQRFEAAREALQAGCHILLEKPPCATLTEVHLLESMAADLGLSMFTAWHSRYAAGVAELRDWCRGRQISRVDIAWKEDVRRWHPGQDWIWQAGGFGVFDPGINALSILTHVLEGDIALRDAQLTIPEDCDTPIAASLQLETSAGAPIAAEFDWRQTGQQQWQMVFRSGSESYRFDAASADPPPAAEGKTPILSSEYLGMYRHFMERVSMGKGDIDCAPLRLVADAFMRGKVTETQAWGRGA